MTFTILSDSLAPRLRTDSDLFPPFSDVNLSTLGFLSLVPVRLCLCGDPVKAVHMEFKTPGLCSHPRLVSSLSGVTGKVWAVALAVMCSPTPGLTLRRDDEVLPLPRGSGFKQTSCSFEPTPEASLDRWRLWGAASIFQKKGALSCSRLQTCYWSLDLVWVETKKTSFRWQWFVWACWVALAGVCSLVVVGAPLGCFPECWWVVIRSDQSVRNRRLRPLLSSRQPYPDPVPCMRYAKLSGSRDFVRARIIIIIAVYIVLQYIPCHS